MKAGVLSAEWKPKPDYNITQFEKETKTAFDSSKIWKNPKFEIRDRPMPKIRSRDVLVRIKACGICGSDISMCKSGQDGYMEYGFYSKFPCIIGHEFVGVVEEIGEEVQDIKVGDIVTADDVVWCNRCDPCRNGYFNCCENQAGIGSTIDGGLAEYIAVEAKQCWKINDLIKAYGDKDESYEVGALIEPFTISYQAMFSRAGGPRFGGLVVVYGAGTIGLTAVILAKVAGAKVINFDVVEEKLSISKYIGADYVFNSTKLLKENSSPSKKVMEISKGQGADMQVEATGSEKVMPYIFESLGINSRVVCIGITSKNCSVSFLPLQAKQSQIYGSMGHAGTAAYPGIINLLLSGTIEMSKALKIITNRCKLEDAPSAIEIASMGKGVKTMVKLD